MASEFPIVKKGNNCLQVAKLVLAEIRSGNSVQVTERLCSLRQDVATLENEADHLTKRFEAVDKYCQDQDAELSRQIGELGVRESQLREQKKEIENSLDGQQRVLQDTQSQLSSAQNNLQEAARKLKKAKEEENKIKVGATVGGALLGLFTGGAGFLVGAGVGAGIGAIVNDCRQKEKDARSALDRRRADVKSADSAIRQSKSKISSLQSNINSLSSQIHSLEQQREELHKLRGEVKAAIPIVKTSIRFWQMFRQITKEGGDHTALLEKIVAMANEKGDYHALQSAGSQRIANTFFEAWEEIESMACEGTSSHMFSIDYTCVQCSRRCNGLPYLSDSDFVCSSCAHQNSGKTRFIWYTFTMHPTRQ